jgi:hypothetical protein
MKELEMVSLIGRRDRILHSEMCKKAKEDIAGVLKGIDISSSMKDYMSLVSLDALYRAIPYYFVMNEDSYQSIFNEILV